MEKSLETYFQNGQWKNRLQGNDRSSSVHDTKAEPRSVGPDTAKNRGVQHLIKNMDGKIGARNSYGKDPHPPKGWLDSPT